MRAASASLAVLWLCTYFAFTVCQHSPNTVRPTALVLTKTVGFYHESQIHAVRFLQYQAPLRNWTLLFQSDLSYFVENKISLQHFNVIIFLLTLGPIFDEPQQQLFLNYVNSGGGVVAVHSAIDTNKHWPFFFTLLGASFVGHPDVQTGLINTTDVLHPTTSFLPKLWSITDEFYNFVEPSTAWDDKHVILTVEESSYQGGTLGDWHPVSWVRYHYPAQSLIWVTTLGHDSPLYNYSQSTFQYFQRHLIHGIEWTANGTAEARSRWANFVEDFS